MKIFAGVSQVSNKHTPANGSQDERSNGPTNQQEIFLRRKPSLFPMLDNRSSDITKRHRRHPRIEW
jgi:hypothetical protein